MYRSSLLTATLIMIGVYGIFSDLVLGITNACLLGVVTAFLISCLWHCIFIEKVDSIKIIFIFQASSVLSLIGVYCMGEQDSLTQIKIGLFIALSMLIFGSHVFFSYVKRKKSSFDG